MEQKSYNYGYQQQTENSEWVIRRGKKGKIFNIFGRKYFMEKSDVETYRALGTILGGIFMVFSFYIILCGLVVFK